MNKSSVIKALLFLLIISNIGQIIYEDWKVGYLEREIDELKTEVRELKILTNYFLRDMTASGLEAKLKEVFPEQQPFTHQNTISTGVLLFKLDEKGESVQSIH